MKKYVFMYDDELTCTRIIDGEVKYFYGDKAINILIKKDKINFRKVKISNNRIVMEGANTQVVLRDLDELYENDILGYFYNNISKINKAINKGNKKSVSVGKVVGFATVGIIAAILMAIAAGKINDKTKDVIPIEFNEDEDLEEEEIVVQNILEEPISELAMKSEIPESELKEDEPTGEINTTAQELIDELNEEEALEQYLNDAQVVSLAYDTTYDQVKYMNAYENHNEDILVRAPRWGVSPSLARGMLTQETGGYNTNLMQVQFKSWHDQPITLYNYETGKMETIILTNHPETYDKQPDTQYITEKDLENPKTNISVGCIILQYSFERMNRNIPAAIQCYNFGTSNMNDVLEAACRDLGISRDELLADQTNIIWIDYRDIIDVGDKNYLEHVLRYISEPDDEIWINYIDENGEVQHKTITFCNENVAKEL